MRYCTREECENWLRERNRQKPDAIKDISFERIAYPLPGYRIRPLALWIATSLTFRMPALLWVTEWGIWPSSENWHLYYKLRQSYGNLELLPQTPGHLFLEHEAEDLASFLQIAMLNGWGGYVLTQADNVNVFFSDDEFLDFFAQDDANLSLVKETFKTPSS